MKLGRYVYIKRLSLICHGSMHIWTCGYIFSYWLHEFKELYLLMGLLNDISAEVMPFFLDYGISPLGLCRMKNLLEGDPEMGKHANTYNKPVNGVEQVTLLPEQSGASYNTEHSEIKENSAVENKPEVAKKKKTYTFLAWKLHLAAAFIIFIFIVLIIRIIYLGMRSQMDQCPSCAFPCPQGWVVHEPWCYYFSPTEAIWNSSRSNCSSQGGSLTAIDTPSEMNFLLREKAKTDYWIGLWREKEQPWKWTNGSDFNSWFPIGADGQCAYLNDRNASSSWCTTERQWICRRPSHQT